MASEEMITKVLLGCWARYSNPPQDPKQQAVVVAAWVEDLGDMSDEMLETAAREYWKQPHQWAPAPGQLRERVLELAGKDAESDGAAAWDWMRDWCYSLARGTTKEYQAQWGRNEAALQALRAIGGFEAFYNRDTQFDWQWRERFIRAYTKIPPQKRLLGAGNAKDAKGHESRENVAERLSFRGGDAVRNSPPAAIAIFQRVQHRYPSKEDAETISNTVGKYFRDLMVWQQVLYARRAKGDARASVAELIEDFRARRDAGNAKDAKGRENRERIGERA